MSELRSLGLDIIPETEEEEFEEDFEEGEKTNDA